MEAVLITAIICITLFAISLVNNNNNKGDKK